MRHTGRYRGMDETMGVKLAEAEAEKLCVTMSAVGANTLDDTLAYTLQKQKAATLNNTLADVDAYAVVESL